MDINIGNEIGALVFSYLSQVVYHFTGRSILSPDCSGFIILASAYFAHKTRFDVFMVFLVGLFLDYVVSYVFMVIFWTPCANLGCVLSIIRDICVDSGLYGYWVRFKDYIVEVPEMHEPKYIRIRHGRIVGRSRRATYKDRTLRMRIALFKRRVKAQFECIAEFASAREERRQELEGYATRMVHFQAEEAQAQARLAEAKEVCEATAQEKAETVAVLRESVRTTSEANQVKNDIKVARRRIHAEEVATEKREVLAVIQTRQQETEIVDGKIDQDRTVLSQIIEARRETDIQVVQAKQYGEEFEALTIRCDAQERDEVELCHGTCLTNVQGLQVNQRELNEHACRLDFGQLECHFAISTREDKIRKEKDSFVVQIIGEVDRQAEVEVEGKSACDGDEEKGTEYTASLKELQEHGEKGDRVEEKLKAKMEKQEGHLDDRMAQCIALRRRHQEVEAAVSMLESNMVWSKDAAREYRRRTIERQVEREEERLQAMAPKLSSASTRAGNKT